MLVFGLILLVGCTTPTNKDCPQVTCPVCRCEQSDELPKEVTFVYFIDVGQGDSILIKNGETEMLIDCGKNSEGPEVVDFLKSNNVGDLEYLLITHPDSDHLGGCDDVLDSFNVHSVITNGEEEDTVSYKEVVAKIDTEQSIIANKGMSWNIGRAEMRVIQSNNGLPDKNDDSIISKLSYGPIDVLFTGDCSEGCEKLLLTKDVQSEILKVSHHGSKYATDINFLEVVKPQVGVISVGQNSYGHPADESLSRLRQEGVLIYRTDLDGTVILKLDGESYEVIV